MWLILLSDNITCSCCVFWNHCFNVKASSCWQLGCASNKRQLLWTSLEVSICKIWRRCSLGWTHGGSQALPPSYSFQQCSFYTCTTGCRRWNITIVCIVVVGKTKDGSVSNDLLSCFIKNVSCHPALTIKKMYTIWENYLLLCMSLNGTIHKLTHRLYFGLVKHNPAAFVMLSWKLKPFRDWRYNRNICLCICLYVQWEKCTGHWSVG